jgi:SAM-dependent methyltransferase
MTARPVAPPEAEGMLVDCALLDAREEHDFAVGHLPGAGRIALREFMPRRAELPPRTARVLVVHDAPQSAREAAEALDAMQYRDVAWLDAPLDALPGARSAREAAARLWHASPFLEQVLPRLSPGRSLDIASGTGRESVHLALNGWSAEAWDHDPEALQRARQLAARHGVTIETRVVELERESPPDPGRGWDLVVVCRFLHRPLLPWIERAVAPGGALVYETFRRGQEVHGRPLNPRYLLVDGELARAFPSLEVEIHEEIAPPGGPVMARLLARRPARS